MHAFNPDPFYKYLQKRTLFIGIKRARTLGRCALRGRGLYFTEYRDFQFGTGRGSQGSHRRLARRGHDQSRWPCPYQATRIGERGFTPKRVNDLEGYGREVMIDLVNKVKAQGECCLVQDLARPLPMRLIGKMLDYPIEKQDEILDWTDVYTHAGCGPDHITGDVIENFGNFTEFHMEFLQENGKSR